MTEDKIIEGIAERCADIWYSQDLPNIWDTMAKKILNYLKSQGYRRGTLVDIRREARLRWYEVGRNAAKKEMIKEGYRKGDMQEWLT